MEGLNPPRSEHQPALGHCIDIMHGLQLRIIPNAMSNLKDGHFLTERWMTRVLALLVWADQR